MKLELIPLRQCQPQQLVELERASFTSDLISLRSFRRLLRSDTVDGHGVLHEGRLVAYSLILFRRNSHTARIYSLAVDAGARGQGLGRTLLLAAIELSRARQMQRLKLEVSTRNASAIRLYERLGFQWVGLRPGFYEDGTDARIYQKQL